MIAVMDQRQKQRAEAWACRELRQSGPWTLSSLQITSTIRPSQWPAARVEFLHEKLGSRLEIATGAGCLDAACNAIAQFFGVTAPICSLDVRYAAQPEIADALPVITAKVEVSVDGVAYRGSAKTEDLLISAVGAYLDALWGMIETRGQLRMEAH